MTETHATVYPVVETLTDRVLTWYGFTYAHDYTLRPYAMLVAIRLHQNGITPDTLHDGADIEMADQGTGGRMRALFNAIHNVGSATEAQARDYTKDDHTVGDYS